MLLPFYIPYQEYAQFYPLSLTVLPLCKMLFFQNTPNSTICWASANSSFS